MAGCGTIDSVYGPTVSGARLMMVAPEIIRDSCNTTPLASISWNTAGVSVEIDSDALWPVASSPSTSCAE